MEFVQLDPLNMKIAKLAALDGFSINQIATSQYLRDLFHRDGMPMRESRATITASIYSYIEERKQITKKFIGKEKNHGRKFSIAADEWTCINNKRFMNAFIIQLNVIQSRNDNDYRIC